MPGSTRATLLLGNLGVNFARQTYGYDPGAERIGLQAADALGVAALQSKLDLRCTTGAWEHRGAGGVSDAAPASARFAWSQCINAIDARSTSVSGP